MDISSARPFSIRLFLPDGSPNGLTVATIPNWAGSVVRCRNASLPALLERAESDRPGVYILQGPDPEPDAEAEGIAAYVGQGGKIRDRLPESANKRVFWEVAAVVTTGDTNFSSGHFLALESLMIAGARASRRVRLVNSVLPREDAGALGEADRAEVDTFLYQVTLVLPVLGFDLLRPQTASKRRTESAPGIRTVESDVRFEIVRKEGAVATAEEQDGEFVVLRGSQALRQPGFSTNIYRRLRDQLLAEQALVLDTNPALLQFTRDVAFASPSAAAAVVLDRNSNGRTEWKVRGIGRSYQDWQLGRAASVGDEQA